MVAWKYFSWTWGIAWREEHGLELLCSSLDLQKCRFWKSFQCLSLFAMSWNCITFNFLFPEIVRLEYSTESKSWLSTLPFGDTSNSKQKGVARVTNTDCILNIPAREEPRYCLLATSSCKCLLWCGFLCLYLDSQVVTSLWQFWNAFPTVPSISRRWAGQIREVSPECAKNGGGLGRAGTCQRVRGCSDSTWGK